MTATLLHPRGLPSELSLPPGRWRGPIWVSDAPLDDAYLYQVCADEFGRTGLWPVLIPYDERFPLPDEDWLDRDRLPPAGDEVAGVDVAATLRDWWLEPCCDGTCLEPYGTEFPGLARRSTRRMDPLAEAAFTGSLLAAVRHECRLGLVRVDRPADVPAVLGWPGMINTTDRIDAISAVLRSWEDRFGATLVVLGFDILELKVAAPPQSLNRAVALAAEHRAFCRYNFTRQPGTLRQFAETLIDCPLWHFWWD